MCGGLRSLLCTIAVCCLCSFCCRADDSIAEEAYQQQTQLSLAGGPNGSQCGIWAVVSQEAATYLSSSLVDILQDNLEPLHLASLIDSAETPVGIVDFNVTNITITNIKIEGLRVTLSAPADIFYSINNLSAHVDMAWRYKKRAWPHLSDSGTATIQLTNSSGSTVSTQIVREGKLVISFHSTVVVLEDIEVMFHGGASWVYNLILALLDPWLSRNIENSIASAITKTANKIAAKRLKEIPPYMGLAQNRTYFSTALVDGTVVGADVAALCSHGDFAYKLRSKYQVVQAKQSSATLHSNTKSMAKLFLRDTVAEAMTTSLWKAGELNFTISQGSLPAEYKMVFNTSFFKFILPPLYKTFPNMGIEVLINVSGQPRVKFTQEGAALKVPAVITLNTIEKDKTAHTAFILNGEEFTLADVSATSDHEVKAKLLVANITLSLIKSNIGEFNLEVLNNEVNFLINALLGVVNEHVLKGVPIPSVGGVATVGERFTWEEEFFVFETDLALLKLLDFKK